MIEQIFKLVQVPGVENLFGSEHEGVHDAPPSITWVPIEAELLPGKSVTQHQGPEPRSIATCHMTVRVRLWAVWDPDVAVPEGYDQSLADQAALWDLLRKFLLLLREKAPGAYELGRARFLGEEGSALTDHGKAADLEVTWSLPVTANARPSVVIPDAAHLTMEGTMDLGTDVTESPAP